MVLFLLQRRPVVLNQTSQPHDPEASDVSVLGGMTKAVSFQNAVNNFHQAKSDQMSTDECR